jgi:hypothetical protein
MALALFLIWRVDAVGTPLEAEPIGDLCPTCFSIGKPFAAFYTPIYLKMILSGFSHGEFWNDADEGLLLAPHYLTQQSDPCYWYAQDQVFHWGIAWHSPYAAIRVWRILDYYSAFNIHTATPCLLQYPDGNVVPEGNVAFDGIIDIEFEEDPI